MWVPRDNEVNPRSSSYGPWYQCYTQDQTNPETHPKWCIQMDYWFLHLISVGLGGSHGVIHIFYNFWQWLVLDIIYSLAILVGNVLDMPRTCHGHGKMSWNPMDRFKCLAVFLFWGVTHDHPQSHILILHLIIFCHYKNIFWWNSWRIIQFLCNNFHLQKIILNLPILVP